jgi:hypothetical protein
LVTFQNGVTKSFFEIKLPKQEWVNNAEAHELVHERGLALLILQLKDTEAMVMA